MSEKDAAVVVRTKCHDCGGAPLEVPANAITVILRLGVCQHLCYRCGRAQTHALSAEGMGALITAGSPFVPRSRWAPYEEHSGAALGTGHGSHGSQVAGAEPRSS